MMRTGGSRPVATQCGAYVDVYLDATGRVPPEWTRRGRVAPRRDPNARPSLDLKGL